MPNFETPQSLRIITTKGNGMSEERSKPGTSINFSDETWRRFFVMALLAGGACSYPAVVKHADEVLNTLRETNRRQS